ncbi:MAG TPA: MAPEG family protein [Caulobacteraceae bacterium]|nr:MAPEG family protein [Caulobacteraceae bacterium]
MQSHELVAIVSLLALLLYFFMSLRVGQARSKYNVPAPAVTGNADFERAYRIQMNTLEWLPIFLVSLWLFAWSWGGDLIPAAIGVVWIVGRVLYLTGYTKAAESRGPGFGIQALAAGVLLFGALGRIIWTGVSPHA